MYGFFQFMHFMMQMAQMMHLAEQWGLLEEDPVLREANWRRFEEAGRRRSQYQYQEGWYEQRYHETPTFTKKGKDYYAVLVVERTATADDIKQAFRAAIKTCHPDLYPDDEEKSQRTREVIEAYDVLSDTDKRAFFDRWGFV